MPIEPERTQDKAGNERDERRSAVPIIRLDQFLKWKGLVESGGQAKLLIQAGEVLVNGEVDTRRGRKLRTGDVVELEGTRIEVELRGSSDA